MNNKGFSLVELIIVIAILGLMLVVLAPMFTQYIFKSQASTDVQNLEQIKKAVEVYYSENSAADSADFVVEQDGNVFKFTGVDKAAIFENANIAEPIDIKSRSWTGIYMKYDPSTNDWEITGTNSVDEDRYDLSQMTQ